MDPKGDLPRISFTAIQNACKEDNVDLAVDRRMSPEALSRLLRRADNIIQQVYEKAGRMVLVEHQTSPIPPSGIEIRFRITPAPNSK